MELLIGCGARRDKFLRATGREEWRDLITMDVNADHNPDIVHDINVIPFPIGESVCDEVHAYEVMEHLGQPGDWRSWFALWSEIWRILKPDGMFFGTSPARSSNWAWGDPGHVRIISLELLTFLDQTAYTKQIGHTPMTDYRFVYQADFDVVLSHNQDETHLYALRAVKPSRIAYANRESVARVA